MDTGMKIGRRNVLKALAGVPVVGLFGLEALRKIRYDAAHDVRKEIVRELGLEDLLSSVKQLTAPSGDLIRIGIIGFGVRGTQLSEALGFMEKNAFEKELVKQKESGQEMLKSQMEHGNLNVAITGICDVFDLRAEKGLATAGNDIFSGGDIARKHPVKRYRTYQEMLADPEIDAVIVTTPDHHHARMTMDAARAGKHVYCEKAPVHREDEIQPLYETIKESGVVYQLGHQIPQNAVFQQAKEIIRREMLGNISQVETTTNRNTPSGAWIRHVTGSGKAKPGDSSSIDWKQWLGKAPDIPFSIRRYYSWARYSEYDTGLFGQLFTHEFDAVNQLLHLGIPDLVSSTGGQYYYTEFGDIPDVLHSSFEYRKKGITLTYSANLTSSQARPRIIYGKDASMSFGESLSMTPDGNSEKYEALLDKGLLTPSWPMVEILPGSGKTTAIDAVSGASAAYYSSRGLTTTNIQGRAWDVAHLHLREWLDCIRHGGQTSANIEMAHQEAIVIAMADISYREKCRTAWDPENKKILRV